MLAGDILSLAADGAIGRLHVDRVAAALRPRRGGGAVIGVERGFALEEPDGTIRHLPPLWDEGLRMNDGACDPLGRFLCGSMAYDGTVGAAALHRLDPDGSTHLVLRGVTTSNGLDWSPDGSCAYYVDTPTRRVDVLDDEGAAGLTNRRPWVTLGEEDGWPDGLTVDSAGGVWLAAYGAGAVRHYDAGGRLDEVVEVGARQVTACTLGGERLDELFVTTSRENLEPDDDPLAGSLFRLTGVTPGLPVRDFAG
jgi:sugar lactone lactonase YvrE